MTAYNWDILIDPKHGASIIKCNFNGQNILHPTLDNWHKSLDPFQSSSFPLIPFSNRIQNGSFVFQGKQFQLSRNRKDQAHPIHGYGWSSNWHVDVKSNKRCELSLRYKNNDWPWSFDVKYVLSVDGPSFSQNLKVKNISQTSMPIGIGFHPYFPDADNAELRFAVDGYWENNEEVLPVKWHTLRNLANFSKLTPLKDLRLDNCFTGWSGTTEVFWPKHSKRLFIEASSNLNHAVIYNPRSDPFFCFEPVSHPNNFCSITSGLQNTDDIELRSGEETSAQMKITVHETRSR